MIFPVLKTAEQTIKTLKLAGCFWVPGSTSWKPPHANLVNIVYEKTTLFHITFHMLSTCCTTEFYTQGLVLVFEIGFHVSQAGLKFLILMPQPTKC